MTQSPTTWMPLDVGDYLADTMDLDAVEHGCYLLLIMHYWRNRGPIHVDRSVFFRITKCDNRNAKNLYDRVSKYFRIENNVWHHKRIDEELSKATGNKDKKQNQTQAARDALAAKRASVTDQKQTLSTDSATDSVTALRAGTPLPLPLQKEGSKKELSAPPLTPPQPPDAVPPAARASDQGGFQKIFEAGIAVFPNLATAGTSAIRAWIAAGCDPELDAVPEIQRHARAEKSVRSWAFFTPGIMEAKATRIATLAEGVPRPPAEGKPFKSFQQQTADKSRQAVEEARKRYVNPS